MTVIDFNPDLMTRHERDAIKQAASDAGLMVEFVKGDRGQEFAVLRCPKWTTFGVVKEGRCWHAYNDKGQGVSLDTSPTELVKMLANW